jgi:hypothetical protein
MPAEQPGPSVWPVNPGGITATAAASRANVDLLVRAGHWQGADKLFARYTN